MKSDNLHSRRNFIQKTLLTGAILPFVNSSTVASNNFALANDGPMKIHVFSKHLQWLNYPDMAEAAAEIGFDGVDLTVRPKGHVLPEKVETDLPKAIEAIKKAGLSHEMMTTAVENADSETDKKVLATAGKLGIKLYRMNWLSYPEDKGIPEAVQQFQQTIKHLSLVNRKYGLTGCYQNHAGNRAGASLWELHQMLQKADAQTMGVQYDIRHAVVEGGLSWQNGLRLIHPHIKMLAVKDFVWTKKENGYVVENVPLGEGMVDFKSYFDLLKKYKINVPISLHFEYPLGGAQSGADKITVDKRVVFEAMRGDLKKLREMLA